MIDLDAAAQFVNGHARLLETRRLAAFLGTGGAAEVLTALAAYRNPDGGYGHLEPDLRTPASQPACLLYALEILAEAGPTDPGPAESGLDWLDRIGNADGGVPAVLAGAERWPHAPWWQPEPRSSLLMTAGLAALGLRLAPKHPWLEPASEYCWSELASAAALDPYTTRYVVDFLDATPDRDRARAELDRLAARLPADGVLGVGGGTEGENLRPLDLARGPEHAAAGLFSAEVIDRELDRLAGGQQADGGWTFDWSAWNPAAAWEWRGVVTVQALLTLRRFGRLPG